jgi:hypothetical protein
MEELHPYAAFPRARKTERTRNGNIEILITNFLFVEGRFAGFIR